MPFEKCYTKELRNIYLLCSSFMQLVLAVTFSYHLYLSLPSWVAQLQESLVDWVYDGMIVPAWDFAYAHPIIALGAGLCFLAVFWPLVMMWWLTALGGVVLLRFSFLIYLFYTLLTYMPVVASNTKRVGLAIPQLYSAYVYVKQMLQAQKPGTTDAKVKKEQ